MTSSTTQRPSQLQPPEADPTSPPQRPRLALKFLALSVLLLASPFVSLGFGSAAVPFVEAIEITFGKAFGTLDTNVWDPTTVAIIWQNRLPRIITALGVGAILGVCGVAMQAVIRNPLAEPYVLGLSAGASTGAAISIVVVGAIGVFAVGSFAFLGSLLATLLVLVLGTGRGGSSLRLVLAGIAIGFLFQAITNLLIVSAQDAETAQSVVFWTLGSLTRPGLPEGVLLFIVAVVLTAGVSLVGPYLDAIASGDHTCVAIGLNPTVIRIGLLVPVSAGVAFAVANTGGIGFIGLVLPHLMRPIIGYSHRSLIVGTALTASMFLLITDTLARTLLSPIEIPVGILTALVGAPFLLVLTRKMS